MLEAAVESLKAEKTQRGEELRTLKAEQEIAARLVRVQLWLVQMLGTFWVGDIVSIYKVGVIHLIKLISDDMSAWEYRAGHEARDLFSPVLGT